MTIAAEVVDTLLKARPRSGPVLSLRERDRRWRGLQERMKARALDAIIVGSFQGRERLESYLIDDFLDAIVILPVKGEAILLSFSGGRLSRMYESARRGFDVWVKDVRVGTGGGKAGEVLADLGLAIGRIGIVGRGPTAPGEMEGLLPAGFQASLTAKLPRATLEDFTQDMTDFMLVKSEEELALLRFAAEVGEQACAAMIGAARPGASEAEVYAEIMREVHRWGCDTRYPFLTLQSGPDNIGWGAPRWTLRAEPPRNLEVGDLVQAEIHTTYGAQESQVQMSVALDPVDPVVSRCEGVARMSYEAGLDAVRPGATFADIVHAMEAPIRASGCWSKTPLLHTLTFGATGFTGVNREQLAGTQEGWLEGQTKPGIRRGDLVLTPGMSLELEPNACLNHVRVNIGGAVVVTADGAEELNALPTRVHHIEGNRVPLG
jgi:Xaa-Pro aminopeptidase